MGTLSVSAVSGHFQSSAVGINYQSLDRLLAAQQWEAAAQETKRLIFEVSRRREQPTIGQDLITQQAIASFPCKDLQTLDQLWRKHSRDRFGFTVQTRIWQQISGGASSQFRSLRTQKKHWVAFTQRLDWQTLQDRQRLPDPPSMLPIAALPDGAFPEPVRSTGDFGDRPATTEQINFFGGQFLDRVHQCHLSSASEAR